MRYDGFMCGVGDGETVRFSVMLPLLPKRGSLVCSVAGEVVDTPVTAHEDDPRLISMEFQEPLASGEVLTVSFEASDEVADG